LAPTTASTIWKFTEVNYRIRPENDDILAALAEIEGM